METAVKELEAFEEDVNWINKNYDMLKSKYPDQYVAVLGQQVVGYDSDLEVLMRRLKENYPIQSRSIAIKYITTKKVELIL